PGGRAGSPPRAASADRAPGRRGSRTRSGRRARSPTPGGAAAARSRTRAARARAAPRRRGRAAPGDRWEQAWRGSLPREQHLARPIQVRLHRVLALLEQARDLLDRAVLEVMELEELALLLGELPDHRVVQPLQAFAELVDLERVRLARDRLEHAVEVVVADRDQGGGALLEAARHGAAREPEEPGAE